VALCVQRKTTTDSPDRKAAGLYEGYVCAFVWGYHVGGKHARIARGRRYDVPTSGRGGGGVGRGRGGGKGGQSEYGYVLGQKYAAYHCVAWCWIIIIMCVVVLSESTLHNHNGIIMIQGCGSILLPVAVNYFIYSNILITMKASDRYSYVVVRGTRTGVRLGG